MCTVKIYGEVWVIHYLNPGQEDIPDFRKKYSLWDIFHSEEAAQENLNTFIKKEDHNQFKIRKHPIM